MESSPHIEYLDIFRDSPILVTETLRKLHEDESNPARYEYVAELSHLLRYNPSENQWNTFFASGLPMTLLDIALDERIYPRGDEDPERLLQYYTAYIFISLLACCRVLSRQGSMSDPVRKSCSLQLLKESPRLWSLLWTKQDYLRYDGLNLFSYDEEEDAEKSDESFHEDDEGLRGLVALIISALVPMHFQLYGRPSSTLFPDHMDYVLFHCWALFNNRCFSAVATHAAGLIINNYSPRQIVKLLQESIIDTGLIGKIVWTFCSLLLDTKVLNYTLAEVVTLLLKVLKHCSHAMYVRMQNRTLLQSICSACQRQLCLGKEDDIQFLTIAHGFKCVLLLCEDAQSNSASLIPVELFENMKVLRLISLAGRSSMMALQYKSFDHIKDIASFLSAHAQFITKALKVSRTNAGALRNIAMSCKVWRSTLKSLRSIQPSPPSSRDLVQIWLRYGKQLGLSEDKNEDEIQVFEPFKSCHWQKCICSGSRHGHPMRVCKGCWSVFYCGARCQQRDWEYGGHKLRCRSST